MRRRQCSLGETTAAISPVHSIAFGERCQKMGVRPSTGRRGDAYDNAMAESFFATLHQLAFDAVWKTTWIAAITASEAQASEVSRARGCARRFGGHSARAFGDGTSSSLPSLIEDGR